MIYRAMPAEHTELCHPTDPDDFERIYTLVDGNSRIESWTPIKMELIREDEGRTLNPSDSPWLGSHALLFNQRAVESMEDLLAGWAEFLPVDCGSSRLWILNPVVVLDALIERESSVSRIGEVGRIFQIQRHVFDEAAVDGAVAFKIPNFRVSPVYLSARFVERWSSHSLRGLRFEHVYPVPLSS